MRLAILCLVAAACGNGKQEDKPRAESPLILDEATCADAEGCAADCERGVVKACALASSAYTLGYKVNADPDVGARYRQRYLLLRTRACAEGDQGSCRQPAASQEKPDWDALRQSCAAGELNACLRCKAAMRGDDCTRTPP